MTKQQKKLYDHPQWQKKRLEILSRDGFKCVACGEDEKTLNVHHKSYIWNNKPWEYEHDNFITYCDKCHKAEHKRLLEEKEDTKEVIIEKEIIEKPWEPSDFKYNNVSVVIDKSTIEFIGNLYFNPTLRNNILICYFELLRIAYSGGYTPASAFDLVLYNTKLDREVVFNVFVIFESLKIIEYVWDKKLNNGYMKISEGYNTPKKTFNEVIKSLKSDIENDMVVITEDLIKKGMSCNGGWKNKQLELLGQGIEKGWKSRSLGTYITKENAEKFIAIRKTK